MKNSTHLHVLIKVYDLYLLEVLLLSGVLGRYEKWGILASHILLSQRPDLKEMQVIHFDRDVQVCGIFHKVPISKIFLVLLWIMNLSFLDECLLFEGMRYLYFFLSFSFLFFMLFGMHFFSHAFWHVYFSFLFFLA